tara:strand:- start:214 stop:675 length:462 start_codon:yes stop_codon:yes gene_type:complete
MDFQNFFKERQRCNDECSVVHSIVNSVLTYMHGFKLSEWTKDHHNFRLIFPEPIGKDNNITKISISIPPDASGNRICDGRNFPMCIETALFSDTDIVYDESLGYEDIMRFYSNERASEICNVLDVIDHIMEIYYNKKTNYSDSFKDLFNTESK